MEQVILVDHQDVEIGTCEKLAAHRSGELHRAFSVFVWNAWGQLLIQQRAATKYHTAGLWTNACDGHPRPGEETCSAARRRLVEEMGIDCALHEVTVFTYRADLGEGLIEREVDHVFECRFDGDPVPDPDEVAAWKWIDLEALRADIEDHPDCYAPWFTIALEHVP
jgi:isopentenyl-diphosphate delta-isomerase